MSCIHNRSENFQIWDNSELEHFNSIHGGSNICLSRSFCPRVFLLCILLMNIQTQSLLTLAFDPIRSTYAIQRSLLRQIHTFE